jgi:hypothetical protein
LSLSHAGDCDGIKDEIEITNKMGKFRFHNLQEAGGYKYEGSFQVMNDRTVLGEWKSTRPGATAKGELLLQIDVQGRSMYGVYSGLHSDGRQLLLGWALGRDSAALDHAITALQANTCLPA